jgi:hypothetical protein
MGSDFRDDRQFEAVPDVHMALEDHKPKWPFKRRHFPAPRPRGLYLEYINQLIERGHSKRDDAADNESWNRRRENELMKDKPSEAA